jgi:hypothetical protein
VGYNGQITTMIIVSLIYNVYIKSRHAEWYACLLIPAVKIVTLDEFSNTLGQVQKVPHDDVRRNCNGLRHSRSHHGTCVCAYVYVYVFVCVCVCVHTCMHVCIPITHQPAFTPRFRQRFHHVFLLSRFHQVFVLLSGPAPTWSLGGPTNDGCMFPSYIPQN